MKAFLRALSIFLIGLISSAIALAQNNPNEEQALKPYDSWHGGDIDSVSLTNGGLSLKIPLVNFPQRGSQDLSFFIRFSNKEWLVKPAVYNRTTGKLITPAQWILGPTPGGQVVSSVDWWLKTTDVLDSGSGQTLYDWSQTVSAPDGNNHQLGGAIAGSGPAYPLRSLDATGILHPDLYTIILANGTHYSYPSADFNSLGADRNGSLVGLDHLGIQATSVTDANGNQITIGPSGWTDTLGRVLPGSATSTYGPVQPGVPTSDLSTCPSGTSSALIWNVPGFNGGTRTFKLCYSMFTLQTSFNPGTTPTDFGPTSESLLSAVVQPDLTMWTFSYDTYGDITRLGFPTGGSISYTYAFGPPNCGTGTSQSLWVTSRTVDANDGNGGHTWHYQYQGNFTIPGSTAIYMYSSKGIATVTDPMGNDTVHNIANPVSSASCSGYDVQTQYYQGSSTSGGILLKTVQTQYGGNANFDNGAYYVATNVVPTQVTTTLPNGGTSTAVNTYDLPTTETTGDQVIIGSLLQKNEYDFSGTLLRSTLTHYLWQDNSTYLTNGFTALPAYTMVKDGSGCEVAKTSHGYDESYGGATLQTSGISTQHAGAPGAVRGNHTSVSEWLVSQCAEQSSFTTHLVPFDTGSVYQKVDANGNTTTYSYSASFAGAFLTQAQRPDTNGIHHITTGNYDLNTGLMTSYTDENSNSFTYAYDNMLRMTAATHPDGGQTLFSFPNNTTVDRQRLMSAGVYDDFKVLFDGLGRTVQTQRATPSGTALVDTKYDADGRVASVSNPYYSTSDLTYGTTQKQYDALGRITKTTKQDGSFESVDYTQPICPVVTDEAGKSRQTCKDALGRLVSVNEDPASLNYQTLYQYDALDNLTSVSQHGGQGSSQYRNRTYVYNSRSHLLSATNPESGITTYTYDANGNTLTRTAPAPNQTGSTTVTTTYSYDALNRVTQQTYSDGTPSVYFLFDTSFNWGVAQPNLVGRLAETYRTNSPTGDEIFGYDAMGRVTVNNQCTPSDCGTGNWSVAATYDLVGDLTSLKYPSGRIVNYRYNSGNELNQVQFYQINGNSPVGGAYNYWSASDGNFYANGSPTKWTLGNGITETPILNNRWQLQEQLISNPALSTFADHTYQYGTQNNGNVLSVGDHINSSRTQTFTYDSLNRLSTGSESRWGLAWVYDPFGNNLQQNVTAGSAFQHQYTATVQNQLSGFPHDAAGNMLSDGTNQYAYDSENRISTVNGTGAAYVYDANGDRVSKTVGSAVTEYVRFNGNVIAEYNPSTGDWSDYIFASDKRIARALGLDNGLRIYGTRCGSCGTQYTLFYLQNAAGMANYAIRSGDKLNLTQYQNTGSHGGVVMVFTDGTNTNWNVKDQDGYYMNDDGTQATAHVRHIDLSTYAGKTIQSVILNQESDTAAGAFAIIYEQVSVTSADGTVQPIYTGESASPVSSIVPTSGVTGTGSHIDVNRNKATYPTSATTYYHTNQVGSSLLITAGNGWPVWQATFLPYGEEYNPQLSDGDHYKYSGKERDAETNLDYFGARYYGNALDRFSTPDPGQVSGFGHLDDPQAWNGYSYARNNPVRYVDPDGRQYRVCDETGHNCSNQSDDEFNKNKADSQQSGEVWQNGKIYVPDGNGGMRFAGTYQDEGPDIPGNAQQNLNAMAEIGAGEQLTYQLYFKSVKDGVLGAGFGIVFGELAGGIIEGLSDAKTAASATRVIFRTQQIEHAMRVEAGHLTPAGTVAEVKEAVTAAVQAKNYTQQGNVIKGVVNINGVAHEFTGFMNPEGNVIFSNCYRIGP